MEGEHPSGLAGQEMHDAYQAYQAHGVYLDPAQAQAMASYMPDFASMDPASQAAAMQHYAQHIPAQEAPTVEDQQQQQQQQVHQSETESDLEEGVDAGEYRDLQNWPPVPLHQRFQPTSI